MPQKEWISMGEQARTRIICDKSFLHHSATICLNCNVRIIHLIFLGYFSYI